jgi:hypothetical protein
MRIVEMGTTWAEHRVFALSMMVYGKVINYVIDMLGKAVIVEQTEKERFGLLQPGYWSKYFMRCDIAVSTKTYMLHCTVLFFFISLFLLYH